MALLTDKVVMITGAAKGMGAATARRMAQEGARVILADIDEGAESVASEIGCERAKFVRLDVRSPTEWDRAIDQAIATFGKLDVLVNNAGILRLATLAETTDEIFQAIFEVNQRGTFNGMRAVLPTFRKAGKGCIINLSSPTGMRAVPGMWAYGTSKWAIRGMTRAAALELAKENIRVNCVCPGSIDTPMLDMLPDEVKAVVASYVPVGRLGTAEEVANVTCFVASDQAAYMTGSEICVDGAATA